jgi:NADH:ubiquinone oxidoreductase subunit 3 (subunit A)
MLESYIPVLVFTLTVLGFSGIALLLSRVIRPENPEEEKYLTYECGEEPVGDAWYQYSVQYYMYAILFVIFDVEILFLYPWALSLKNMAIFLVGVVFLIIVFLGLAYEWKKRALEWQW